MILLVKIFFIVLVITIFSFSFVSNVFAESDWPEAFPSLQYLDDFEFQYSVNYYIYQTNSFEEHTLLLFNTVKAFDKWDALNSQLKFNKVNDKDNAQITIRGVHNITSDDENYHSGGKAFWRFEGSEILENRYTDILIDMGYYDCKNNFIFLDHNSLENIIMHEIGHAIGLGHTNDVNHLMFGKPDKVDFFYSFQTYDDLEFTIPERILYDKNQEYSLSEYGNLVKELEFKKLELFELQSKNGKTEQTKDGLKYNWFMGEIYQTNNEIYNLQDKIYQLVTGTRICSNFDE